MASRARPKEKQPELLEKYTETSRIQERLLSREEITEIYGPFSDNWCGAKHPELITDGSNTEVFCVRHKGHTGPHVDRLVIFENFTYTYLIWGKRAQ